MQTINIQQTMELLKEGAEKFCIYCDTQHWATQLLESTTQLKYKWIGGNNIGQTLWETYQENTCYFFNPQTKEIEYCDARYAHKHGYTVYTMDAFGQRSPRNKYRLYHTDIKKYIGIAGGKMVFTNATINGLNRQVEFTEEEIQNNSLIQTFLTITEPHKSVKQRC